MKDDRQVREGVVLSRESGGAVEVLVLDLSVCKGCEGGCNDRDHENSVRVHARDPIGVTKRDKVELEINPRSFGKVSAIVFGVPAVSLLSGLGLGTLLSNFFLNGNYIRAFQGGLSGLLFLLSLTFLILYDRHLADSDESKAVITRKLD